MVVADVLAKEGEEVETVTGHEPAGLAISIHIVFAAGLEDARILVSVTHK